MRPPTDRADQASRIAVADIFLARRRIGPYIRRTPLVGSTWLSDVAGAAVSLKLESLQVTNSFKARGAFNAVLTRVERGSSKSTRLVTASAGNHGRALALAAHQFGLPLTVFTPVDVPKAKAEAIVRHGAELRAEAADYDDAERMAQEYAIETGAEFVSPYNDLDVIAGAGTIALEIVEDAPGTDAIVVPVGGGGLVSGLAAALKHINSQIEVTGVEVEASCAFQTSLRVGRLVRIVPGPTLADGLGGNPDPETVTFGYIQQFVDRIVTVSEEDLSAAIRGLAEFEHLIAEGAGASATAAIVGGRVDLAGRSVAVILSGSNIDGGKLGSVLGSG